MSTVGAFYIPRHDPYQTDRVRKTIQTIEQQLAQRDQWQHDVATCPMCRYWMKAEQVLCPGYYAIEHGINVSGMINEPVLVEISKLITLDRQAAAKVWIGQRLQEKGINV